MDKPHIVFDASTMILLAKITLLRKLTNTVTMIICDEVRDESVRKKTVDAKIIEQLITENNIIVDDSLRGSEGVLVKDFNVDSGEAVSVLLARKLKTVLATDDKAAMKACKVLGLEFTTAINFLVIAKRLNVINKQEACAKLRTLEECGRYVNEIIQNAKQKLEGDEA